MLEWLLNALRTVVVELFVNRSRPDRDIAVELLELGDCICGGIATDLAATAPKAELNTMSLS
jgi:hypothetical protein